MTEEPGKGIDPEQVEQDPGSLWDKENQYGDAASTAARKQARIAAPLIRNDKEPMPLSQTAQDNSEALEKQKSQE